MADLPVSRVDGPRGGVGRTYVRHSTGAVVPSVTTVVALTPKPYLMNWVVKLAAEWAADNVMDLYQLPDVSDRVAAIKAATNTLRNEGASKGTALHEYAEQYVWLGIANPPEDNAQQAVLEIVDALQPTIMFTECIVWNEEVGYAGTLDGIWRVEWEGKRETWLIDWKTSKSRSAEWALQQEAYRRAETIIDGRGIEYIMPQIDRMVILWTPYIGDWEVVPVEATEEDWVAFCAARTFFNWTQARPIGAVFGQPLIGRKSGPTGGMQ